jgi:hypothetical protein
MIWIEKSYLEVRKGEQFELLISPTRVKEVRRIVAESKYFSPNKIEKEAVKICPNLNCHTILEKVVLVTKFNKLWAFAS